MSVGSRVMGFFGNVAARGTQFVSNGGLTATVVAIGAGSIVVALTSAFVYVGHAEYTSGYNARSNEVALDTKKLNARLAVLGQQLDVSMAENDRLRQLKADEAIGSIKPKPDEPAEAQVQMPATTYVPTWLRSKPVVVTKPCEYPAELLATVNSINLGKPK